MGFLTRSHAKPTAHCLLGSLRLRFSHFTRKKYPRIRQKKKKNQLAPCNSPLFCKALWCPHVAGKPISALGCQCCTRPKMLPSYLFTYSHSSYLQQGNSPQPSLLCIQKLQLDPVGLERGQNPQGGQSSGTALESSTWTSYPLQGLLT